MIGWVILAVYVVGYVACFRLAVRGMAKDLGGADDWVDIVMFTMGGLFAALSLRHRRLASRIFDGRAHLISCGCHEGDQGVRSVLVLVF
jgi:hypothetical protein